MNVINRLPGGAAMVNDHPITGTGNIFFLSKAFRDLINMSDNSLISQLLNKPGMLFGHQQDVDRGLRRNVVESNYLFILINNAGGYLFVNNFTEEAHSCS